jgi:putative hydrolase of the HAD superfamily
MLDVIAFDADDTLWHNESIYNATQEQYTRLLAKYIGTNGVNEAL